MEYICWCAIFGCFLTARQRPYGLKAENIYCLALYTEFVHLCSRVPTLLCGGGWVVGILRLHLMKRKEHIPMLQSSWPRAARVTSLTFYLKDPVTSHHIVKRIVFSLEYAMAWARWLRWYMARLRWHSGVKGWPSECRWKLRPSKSAIPNSVLWKHSSNTKKFETHLWSIGHIQNMLQASNQAPFKREKHFISKDLMNSHNFHKGLHSPFALLLYEIKSRKGI